MTLIPCGKNEDGEMEFMGTQKDFEEHEQLHDEAIDLEIKSIKEELPECEICGDQWQDNNEEEVQQDIEHIKQTRRCIYCYEEYGDILFADQI